jgi:3-hydroxyisobutyrate dehydrogenase-like beta-hydroxyacid dehydrogenase
MDQASAKIGFIGLGNMGGPMAKRLAGLGLRLAVHDVNEAGMRAVVGDVQYCASPRDVANAADVVLLSLPTPDIVQRVALGDDGLLHGSAVKAVVDLSTIGPRAAARVGDGLAAKGIGYADAPVSGGVTGAGAGKLTLMVSCVPAVYERISETLQLLGKTYLVGDKPGQGQTLKLVNNMLSACALGATAEALVFGAKCGMDPALMLEVLNASSGRNSATTDKFPRAVLPRTFDFGFSTELALKDVNLCVAESEAAGVPMLMGTAAKEMLFLTKATRGPQSDFTEICRMVEEWGGATVESKKA